MRHPSEVHMDIIFLEPTFKERIWGGDKLKSFGYHLPFQHTGECWAISAHKNGESIVKNGPYQGKPLSIVYQNERHLFGNIQHDVFPLLIKILDAEDDLSVQVHPDDHYAKEVEHDLGKTECWYVLDAAPDAHIIYGHRAQTKEAFKKMIDEGKWDELLIKKHVKKGDFIYVPSKTIHALGKGLLILETQQSSDTTYRLYDYDRKDALGKTRELHIEKSIEVARIPHIEEKIDQKEEHFGSSKLITLIDNRFFKVMHLKTKDQLKIPHQHFTLVSVIDGFGKINGHEIKKGDHFIVTTLTKMLDIEGRLECIMSSTH